MNAPFSHADYGTRGTTGFGQSRIRVRSNGRKSFSCERFAHFMRARFPRATEQHLASLTGQPVATCRKHLTGECRPGADAVLAYVSVFGPDFLSAMLPACGWAERAADDEARRELRDHLERVGRRL